MITTQHMHIGMIYLLLLMGLSMIGAGFYYDDEDTKLFGIKLSCLSVLGTLVFMLYSYLPEKGQIYASLIYISGTIILTFILTIMCVKKIKQNDREEASQNRQREQKERKPTTDTTPTKPEGV